MLSLAARESELDMFKATCQREDQGSGENRDYELLEMQSVIETLQWEKTLNAIEHVRLIDEFTLLQQRNLQLCGDLEEANTQRDRMIEEEE